MSFTLELVTGLVDRTTWWKDENTREPANVWWITGPGVSRPATDIEIDLWCGRSTMQKLLAVEERDRRAYRTALFEAQQEIERLKREINALKLDEILYRRQHPPKKRKRK